MCVKKRAAVLLPPPEKARLFLAQRLLKNADMFCVALIMALSFASAPCADCSNACPANGPPVAEVQQRAIEHARLDPSEISLWKKRARLAPLLPRIQFGYDNHVRDYVNVDVRDSVYVGSSGTTVGPPEGSYRANRNNDNAIGVKATWSFNEALFNRDMLAISSEARQLARERSAILSEVNKSYYAREKAAGEIAILSGQLKEKPGDYKIAQQILVRRVAIRESEAALDALTGGWFGEQGEKCKQGQ